jgi:hypothetical protein
VHNKLLRSVARSVVPSNPDELEGDDDGPKYTPGTLALCTFFNLMGAGAIPEDLMYILRDVKSFYIIKKMDNDGNVDGVRPIGARSIFVRIFGKGVACSLLQELRRVLGLNNFVLDHVGVEKLVKICVGTLEYHPEFVGLFPDIINAFNSMDRAKMLSVFAADPACGEAMHYLKIAYMEFPELIDSCDETIMKSESGATQGCPMAMMLFAYAFSKVFDKLRVLLNAQEATVSPIDKTFMGAIADDASIIGTPYNTVLMYLNMQKIADEDFNLKFHSSKCTAFSFGLNKEEMTRELEHAQTEILRGDRSLQKYRIIFRDTNESKAIDIRDDGIRLLGVPIGLADFKLQYMRNIFREVKQDWEKVKAKVLNPKRRLDLLKHCLNPRFNHLFRCVEPDVTTQIADELDNWFFEQVCTVICPHWQAQDRNLFRQFMSPIWYGGSGMTPFRTKIDVAYVASYLDCLFDKGIAFNGVLPTGSKPLTKMHAVFAPLALTREELPKDAVVPSGPSSERLETWASNFKLMDFSVIDPKIKSFGAFRDACKRLFQIPEIRRACFEAPLAYHAINGKKCYIHQKLAIPLPSRSSLHGNELWNNLQHRNFETLPTNKRDDALHFAHSNFKKSTAYDKLPQGVPHVLENDALQFYNDHLSSGECLIWLLGRPDDDGSNGRVPFWS